MKVHTVATRLMRSSLNRRRFVLALATVLAVKPTASWSQRPQTIRLGYIAPGPRNPYTPVLLGALRELGYVEGRNLTVEYRLGTPQQLPAMAEDLARMKVDIIFAGASSGVRAAVAATKDIPIVATDLETDPVGKGYVRTLARPGGNLTGFFLDLPEFSAKRLEVLKEALPSTANVMVLWDATLDRAPLSKLDEAAQRLDLRLILAETRAAADLRDAFARAIARKADAVLVMQSPSLDERRDEILAMAADHRLPVMAVFANFAAGGALLSYGPDVADMIARSARYVDKVIGGVKPGDLPIQRPVKFNLVVNLKTAKSLGIDIGQALLVRADELIR